MRPFRFMVISAALFFLAGTGQAGWVRLYWAGNWLTGIDFPEGQAQTGYVVGEGATIVKTTDGGANWEVQNPGTTRSLKSVCFPVNASTGFIIGSGGFIGKTTDGGSTWLAQNGLDTLATLYSIDFPVDAQTGYIVGDTGGGFFPYGLKTNNGGANWTAMGSLSNVAGGLFSVDFPVDALNGFIVGETNDSIYKTNDGGANWMSQYMGIPNAYTVQFPHNTSTGFVAGGNGEFAYTIDGGGIWWPQNTPLGNCYTSCFLNTDTGYIGGDEDTTYFCSIMKTTDGGLTWEPQLVDTGVAVWCIDFPVNADTGYACSNSGWIYKTTDGGGVGVEKAAGVRGWPPRFRMTVTPNPFVSSARVLGREGERFAIYDISGRKVGIYRGDRVGEGLKAGVYFLRPKDGSTPPVRVVKVR